jgi:hypothetical protein
MHELEHTAGHQDLWCEYHRIYTLPRSALVLFASAMRNVVTLLLFTPAPQNLRTTANDAAEQRSSGQRRRTWAPSPATATALPWQKSTAR